jgi:hypothetical protein
VALYVDEHTERGIKLDQRTKDRFSAEVKRLLPIAGEEALADAVPRMVEFGAAAASLGEFARTAGLRRVRGESVDAEVDRRFRECVASGWPTGWRWKRQRNGQGGVYVRDMWGRDQPPADQPRMSPTKEEMKADLRLDVIRERERAAKEGEAA